ncbi:hypothetical protein ACFOD4_04550 [Pseudoroseomonas globiformis]|uniref:Uncharacterized protein n=1 Tax=Teichococcus globiformis TaxID=2307229 RepID=A0ABV7FVB6_9PROT
MADMIDLAPYLHRRRVRAAGERVSSAMVALFPSAGPEVHQFLRHCLDAYADSATLVEIIRADDLAALHMMRPVVAAVPNGC